MLKHCRLIAGLLLLAVLIGAWGFHLVRTAREAGWTRDAAKLLLSQFDFARGMLMPSHWVVRGLLAAKNGDPAEVIDFDPDLNRWGDVWSMFVPGLRPGQLYHFQAVGPYEPERGHRFDPQARLIDPYA